MSFYSFVVWTPAEIQLREKGIVLDPGTNAFNVQVDDVDLLKAHFNAAGARVVSCNRLDEYEAIEVDAEITAAKAALSLPSGDSS